MKLLLLLFLTVTAATNNARATFSPGGDSDGELAYYRSLFGDLLYLTKPGKLKAISQAGNSGDGKHFRDEYLSNSGDNRLHTVGIQSLDDAQSGEQATYVEDLSQDGAGDGRQMHSVKEFSPGDSGDTKLHSVNDLSLNGAGDSRPNVNLKNLSLQGTEECKQPYNVKTLSLKGADDGKQAHYVKKLSPDDSWNQKQAHYVKDLSPDGAGDSKHPHCVKDRSVIVQLFSWRWDDIARECSQVLGPAGYCGVQVSPPSEHRVILYPWRPWYERYQPVSYRLNSRSGDEYSFRRMVEACNSVGVRVYVDAVINHMTGAGSGRGSAGSAWDGDALTYPGVPFTRKHFHCCDCSQCGTTNCDIQDYNDAIQVRNCRLLELRDLALSQPYVRRQVVLYLNRLLDLGVAGFRVDAAKHMWPAELSAIVNQLHHLNRKWFPTGSKAFIYQEVIDYGSATVGLDDYTGIGRVTDFSFGLELSSVLRKSDGSTLAGFQKFALQPDQGLVASGDALVFIDNHDNQRGHGGGGSVLTFREPRLYKMATALMLALPYGVSRVMSSYFWTRHIRDGRDLKDWMGPPSDTKGNIRPVLSRGDGSCAGGWVCEHRWLEVIRMVEFSNICGESPVKLWWDNNGHQVAFARGHKGFIAVNNEAAWDMDQVLRTGLPAGKYCDVITGHKTGQKCSGRVVTVDTKGKARIWISHRAHIPILAFHTLSKLPTIRSAV